MCKILIATTEIVLDFSGSIAWMWYHGVDNTTYMFFYQLLIHVSLQLLWAAGYGP